jgi:hypothetical protein
MKDGKDKTSWRGQKAGGTRWGQQSPEREGRWHFPSGILVAIAIAYPLYLLTRHVAPTVQEQCEQMTYLQRSRQPRCNP